MYLTGTQYNLENRLHQLPTGESDLTNFQTETGGYSLDLILVEKLNEEIAKKEILFGI
jgi:hypothetical protein